MGAKEILAYGLMMAAGSMIAARYDTRARFRAWVKSLDIGWFGWIGFAIGAVCLAWLIGFWVGKAGL